MVETAQFPQSFLSSPLISLLRPRDFNPHDNSMLICRTASTLSGCCVTSHCTFKWESIEPFFELLPCNNFNKPFGEEGKLCSLSNSICKRLWHALNVAGQSLLDCVCPPTHLWRWTNCSTQLHQCLQEMRSGQDVIVPLKASLLLSSIFERSLGNVYLTKGHCVPFLLRDLIQSDELLEIFGPIPMMFAQFLLGSPYAFNIRNVCWHGFPAPEEIDMNIAASLMVLIFSFGEILADKKMEVLPARPQFTSTDWEPQVEALLSSRFPSLQDACSDISSIIPTCAIIPKTHQQYWLSAIAYFNSKRYGESLLLLLPALEHLLRCFFCISNACPKRLLLAEQHTFYTTIDEILAEKIKIQDGGLADNCMRGVLGDPILQMLMDLFHYSAGPRVRDKFSHGECELDHIPVQVVNHVLCVCLLIFGKTCDLSGLVCQSQLSDAENMYVSKFHPSAILMKKLHFLMLQLTELKSCYQSSGSNLKTVFFEVSDLQSVLENIPDPNFSDIKSKIASYLSKRVSMLYCSKSDTTSISILLKIATMALNAVQNCQSSFKKLYQLHSDHRLRSRQRQTYHRMLEYLSSFHSVYQCLALILLMQLHSLQKPILRQARAVLKYTENMASLSSIEKNQWEEMKGITEDISVYIKSNLSTGQNHHNVN